MAFTKAREPTKVATLIDVFKRAEELAVLASYLVNISFCLREKICGSLSEAEQGEKEKEGRAGSICYLLGQLGHISRLMSDTKENLDVLKSVLISE